LNDDERKILENKIARLKIFPKYIKDPWVVLSFFTDVLILLVILIHIANVANHTTVIALWEGR